MKFVKRKKTDKLFFEKKLERTIIKGIFMLFIGFFLNNKVIAQNIVNISKTNKANALKYDATTYGRNITSGMQYYFIKEQTSLLHDPADLFFKGKGTHSEDLKRLSLRWIHKINNSAGAFLLKSNGILTYSNKNIKVKVKVDCFQKKDRLWALDLKGNTNNNGISEAGNFVIDQMIDALAESTKYGKVIKNLKKFKDGYQANKLISEMEKLVQPGNWTEWNISLVVGQFLVYFKFTEVNILTLSLTEYIYKASKSN